MGLDNIEATCTNYLVTPRLPVQDVIRQQYEIVILGPQQNLKTPNLHPMANNAITGVVYKVWDLPCIDVIYTEVSILPVLDELLLAVLFQTHSANI